MLTGCGQILSYAPDSVVGRLIGWQTRFPHDSHTALLYPDGQTVIESYQAQTVFAGRTYPSGVRQRPLLALGRQFQRYDIPEMTPGQWADALQCAEQERGQGYAYRDIARFLLRRDPRTSDPETGGDPDLWFCTELASWSIWKAYRHLQNMPDAHIAPGMLVASPLCERGAESGGAGGEGHR